MPAFAAASMTLTDLRSSLEEACEPVQDERPGHGNVEAGADSDHRDLDGHVKELDRLGRDARLLVPQHGHGTPSRSGQVSEPDRFIGQLHADNPRPR